MPAGALRRAEPAFQNLRFSQSVCQPVIWRSMPAISISYLLYGNIFFEVHGYAFVIQILRGRKVSDQLIARNLNQTSNLQSLIDLIGYKASTLQLLPDNPS